MTARIVELPVPRRKSQDKSKPLTALQVENRYVACFPQGVNRPIRYGLNLKANAVYMTQYQLIPYDRIRDHFRDHQLAVSKG